MTEAPPYRVVSAESSSYSSTSTLAVITHNFASKDFFHLAPLAIKIVTRFRSLSALPKSSSRSSVSQPSAGGPVSFFDSTLSISGVFLDAFSRLHGFQERRKSSGDSSLLHLVEVVVDSVRYFRLPASIQGMAIPQGL